MPVTAINEQLIHIRMVLACVFAGSLSTFLSSAYQHSDFALKELPFSDECRPPELWTRPPHHAMASSQGTGVRCKLGHVGDFFGI